MPATLGWAVGADGDNGGIILHTPDGGTNWSVQFQMSGIGSLRGIDFTDADTGWAVGGAGTILHTSDRGAAWSPQSSGYGRTIYSVNFLDAQNGWAAGQGPGSLFEGTTGIGTVYHTTNGGGTWSFQHVGLDRYRGTSSFFDIDFADPQHGVATGNSFLGGNERYRTSDGGATWTPLDIPGYTLGPLDFVDAQHGWGAGTDIATGNSVILFSSDAGATWSPQFAQSGLVLRDIAFADLQHGLAVGNEGAIVYSNDGGTTWSVQSGVGGGSLVGTDYSDSQNAWAVSLGDDQGVGIFHSSNGGATWSRQFSGAIGTLFDVTVVNDTIAAAIDVKPGNTSNPINLASEGVIPIALFGTDSFDVTQVDLNSIRFAGASVFLSALQDVNGDGKLDLMLQFRTQDANLRNSYKELLAAADTTIDGSLDPGVSTHQQFRATLTGKMLNGQSFAGSDTVDLFLSGLELRQLLNEMAADGLI